MVKLLLIVAFLATLFAQGEIINPAAQLLPIGLLILTAVVFLYRGAVFYCSITEVEVALIFSIVLSLIISMLRGDSYGLIYSTIFFLVVLAYSIIARSLIRSDVENIISIVAFCMPFISIAFNYDDWVVGLRGEVTDIGLIRFSPFGMHPNLTGYIFGGMMLASMYSVILNKIIWMRIVQAVAFVGSFSVIMAASARGGLVALLMVVMVNFVRNINKIPKNILAVVFIAAVIILIYILSNEDIIIYTVNIFDLESDTRGIDSGGSGRSELWMLGVNKLFSDYVLIFFGGGYRSAGLEQIGFHTENSYITIFLENGIICGVLLVTVIFKSMLNGFNSAKKFAYVELLPAIVMYSLLQSMVNRYLLAVGNVMSLIMLLVVIKISVDENFERRYA